MKFRDPAVRIIWLGALLRAITAVGHFLPLGSAFLWLRTSDSPVQLRAKFAVRFLRIHASALVVIRDHDRLRSSGADDTTGVVEHREMQVEAYLFAMMSAVACDT